MLSSLETCEASQILGTSLTSVVTSLLLSQGSEAGIFSRITMTSMTSAWYHPINHFEAILVGLVLLQIFVMRYMLILPLDLSNLIDHGIIISKSLSKRKRRETLETEDQRLIDTVLTAVKRLDRDDCFLKSLCELQSYSSAGHKLPTQVLKTISTLKRLGLNRRKEEHLESSKNQTTCENTVLLEIQEAVLTGDELLSSRKTNDCEIRYHLCPMKGNEIIENLSSYFFVLNEM